MATMKTTNEAIDSFVLGMIAGTAGGELLDSIKRLFTTGQITRKDLIFCVEKGFLDLWEYNLVIEELEGVFNND